LNGPIANSTAANVEHQAAFLDGEMQDALRAGLLHRGERVLLFEIGYRLRPVRFLQGREAMQSFAVQNHAG
jgi:hypothetical protein